MSHVQAGLLELKEYRGMKLHECEQSSGRVAPKAGCETQMCMQIVTLGGDPRKHQEGNGEMRQGEEGSHL